MNVEKILFDIAKDKNFKITKVNPVQFAIDKGKDRETDKKLCSLIAQEKNDMLKGTIEVLDWTPLLR